MCIYRESIMAAGVDEMLGAGVSKRVLMVSEVRCCCL